MYGIECNFIYLVFQILCILLLQSPSLLKNLVAIKQSNSIKISSLLAFSFFFLTFFLYYFDMAAIFLIKKNWKVCGILKSLLLKLHISRKGNMCCFTSNCLQSKMSSKITINLIQDFMNQSLQLKNLGCPVWFCSSYTNTTT